MKKCLLPLALLALGQTSFAVEPPSAGSQLQQVPATPELRRPEPEIRIERKDAPPAAAGDDTRITVQRLRVSGAEALTEVTEAELLQASGFVPGAAVMLADLRAMAARISTHLQQRGYFLAQAYLPAQESRDGEIRIAVLPGQYGRIALRNGSGLSDGLVEQLAGGLQGQAVTMAPLERRLLLLSDLPGARVKSTLAPGAAPGATDLLVEMAPGARITGSVDADNLGSRYTGRNRVGGTLNLNGLAGLGDVASLRVFTSADGLNYARGSYQLQLGATRVGAAYGYMDYRLGQEFQALDAKGTAKVATLYASYPLVRSRSANLYAQANVDVKRLSDRTDATGSVTNKDIRLVTLNLNGNTQDSLLGGGANYVALGWTLGQVDIRTPDARLVDGLSARSNGHFDKLSLSASRLQYLAANTTLFGALGGQWASKNLDTSEKLGLGGVGGVRAYPAGEAYGDEGFTASVELRQALPLPQAFPAGRLQVLGFYDIGSVRLSRNRYASGDNRRTLSGVGIGLDWLGHSGLALKAYYAHKTGNEKATSVPDRSGRFWLQAVQYF